MPWRALPPKTPTPPRRSAASRGYDRRWRKAARNFLDLHPLCVFCLRDGRAVGATVVDHIVRHEGQLDPLFWDVANWQPLCKACHDRKTASGN